MEKPAPHHSLTPARWRPGWHRLDPSLRIGQTGRFWFFRSAPADCDVMAPGADAARSGLEFFNRLVDAEVAPQVRSATVVGLEHPVLGPLRAIDTAGLDYVFVTADGRDVVVNAEEEAGLAYDLDDVIVSDWTVRVLLKDVSEPLEDLA